MNCFLRPSFEWTILGPIHQTTTYMNHRVQIEAGKIGRSIIYVHPQNHASTIAAASSSVESTVAIFSVTLSLVEFVRANVGWISIFKAHISYMVGKEKLHTI